MGAQGFFVLVGQDGGRWPLGPVPITIGRTADSTIQLPDLRVSRTHARVWRARGRCWVRDERTTHGTYVNEQRLTGQRELCLGDQVRVADYRLRLALASEPDSSRGCVPFFKERVGRRTLLLAALVAVLALLLIALAVWRPWDQLPDGEGARVGSSRSGLALLVLPPANGQQRCILHRGPFSRVLWGEARSQHVAADPPHAWRCWRPRQASWPRRAYLSLDHKGQRFHPPYPPWGG